MESKVWVWKNVTGVPDRSNDVIYTRPRSQPSQDILVYFGGDFQDTQENMRKHSNSKKYIKWSLDNTATILSEQFPKNHIFVVRAARMSIIRSAVFSCFDNFVSCDKYGTPTFCPMYKALKHLRELVLSCVERVKALAVEENISDCDIEVKNISLLGFSKGCAVLNQFLHEFHYYDEHPNADPDVTDFVKLIRDVWWLDGGHNGFKDTWITQKDILQSFAKLNINAHIHVTPYQMRDDLRPWIRMEINSFNQTLKSMGVPVERELHFDDKPASLSSHFNILTDMRQMRNYLFSSIVPPP